MVLLEEAVFCRGLPHPTYSKSDYAVCRLRYLVKQYLVLDGYGLGFGT